MTPKQMSIAIDVSKEMTGSGYSITQEAMRRVIYEAIEKFVYRSELFKKSERKAAE